MRLFTDKEKGRIQETVRNSLYWEPGPDRCWQEGKVTTKDDRDQVREGLTSAKLRIFDFILRAVGSYRKVLSRRVK